MEAKNIFLLQDTEEFMRGELDNVTVAEGRVSLDVVQGGHVPYGCYTSPAVPMPLFDAVRVSWNGGAPQGTALEAQARVLVDGNWTAWCSFGRWSPYLPREGAKPAVRGPLVLQHDQLLLDSKVGSQVQLRIYLYSKDEKLTPTVSLLGVSVRPVDVIPAGGRPVNTRLHLMPYVMARRAPALRPVMDLAICLTSLTNRWGADILPEEFASALWDFQPGAEDPRNLSFGAAAAGCWGFPAWACWGDLALLRAEARAGFGVVVALESTPAQIAAGLPAVRFAALRGFAEQAGAHSALLIDPWAGVGDFDAETRMPLDEFLVAWNNLALCLRPRRHGIPEGCPARSSVWLREDRQDPGLYQMHLGGNPHPLPDDFCGPADTDAEPAADAPAEPAAGVGVLAWSLPDSIPHATAAHRTLHFVRPEKGGIRLEKPAQTDRAPLKYTVYAIDRAGNMLVGDALV